MKKILKWLSLSFFIIFIFLTILFVAVQNSFLLKKYIVPEISKSINIPISAQDISFSILSSLSFKDLEVGDDKNSKINISSFKLSYDLVNIIRHFIYKEEKIELAIKSSDLDINSINKFIESLPKASIEKEVRQQEITNNYCHGIDLSYLWLDLDLNISKLIYEQVVASDIRSNLQVKNNKVSIPYLYWKQADSRASFSADLDFINTDCKFSYLLNLKKSSFSDLLKSFGLQNTGIKKGVLNSLKINGSGKGFLAEELSKYYSGSLMIDIENAELPSSLQDFPPFNIIFLPFEIIMDLGGSITSFILPDKLVNIGSTTREALSSSGEIHLKRAEIELSASKGSVDIKKAKINTDILPTVSFDGEVSYIGDLDMTTTLHLFGIQLRIPIAGTINKPLPDIVELAPQLVKGLGLTLISPVKDLSE